MPFCRECGKEVQADWVSCPYCSQTIGPPVSLMNVQDSVVSGDVNITQNVGNTNTNCTNCNSSGSVQVACSSCKEMAYCEVCSESVAQVRQELICTNWTMDELTNRLCDTCFNVQINDDSKFVTVSLCCGRREPLQEYPCLCVKCLNFHSVRCPRKGSVFSWDSMYAFDRFVVEEDSQLEEYHLFKDLFSYNFQPKDWEKYENNLFYLCNKHVLLPPDFDEMCRYFFENIHPAKSTGYSDEYVKSRKKFGLIKWADDGKKSVAKPKRPRISRRKKDE